MTDIPTHSFGSVEKWHRKTDADLLAMFNLKKLPQSAILDGIPPSYKLITRVVSLLRMKPTTMEEWWKLPSAGKFIGTTGVVMLDLWEWTLTFRKPRSQRKCGSCPATQPKSNGDIPDEEARCKVDQYLKRSQPLAR